MRQGGRSSDRPLVLLFETAAQRQIVAHACEQAQAAGIRPGLAFSAARAALKADRLLIEPHDPIRTRRALQALALWCHRYSPVVAEEDAAGLALDVTGCAHLFGGERKMIDRVRKDLDRLGFRTRAAIAPTFAAARAIARHGPADTAIVAPEELRQALESLSVEALALDEGALAELAEVNLSRIGHLLALPRGAIAARFGEEIPRVLDRLLGRAAECIVPIRPAEPLRVEEIFEGPCPCLETIGAACRLLLERLCARLAQKGAGVIEWRVILERSDLEAAIILIRHCAPSREAEHLWRLLEPRLERVHLGFGVEGVSIHAMRLGRIDGRQRRWWGAGADEARSVPAEALMDTLVNRLGEEAVRRGELLQSHVPERSFVLRSVLHPPGAPMEAALCPGDRPTHLFPAPFSARVIALNPDGPAVQVEWRGGVHRLIACLGPERLKGEWWERQRLLRDYFKVQDEQGQWLWIYRDALLGRWFVHGMWA